MGGKVRHTRLSKVDHPYVFGEKGKGFRVWIDERGRLSIFREGEKPMRVLPYSPHNIVLEPSEG